MMDVFFAGNSNRALDLPIAFLTVALVAAIVLLSLMDVYDYFVKEYNKTKKEKRDE